MDEHVLNIDTRFNQLTELIQRYYDGHLAHPSWIFFKRNSNQKRIYGLHRDIKAESDKGGEHK